MTAPLIAALVTLPRAGQVRIDARAARKVPGVAAVLVAPDWGDAQEGTLPAGHPVAAIAATGDAALRRAVAALKLDLTPVPPRLTPDLPGTGLRLHMARGVLDPLADLSVSATPASLDDGPLHQRIAAALARAARAPVRLMLTAAEANAILPQRPAAFALARVDAGGMLLALARQAPAPIPLPEPPLAVTLPLTLTVPGQVMNLPRADPLPAGQPDPLAVAAVELALADQALRAGQDPLARRLTTLPAEAQAALNALAPNWGGPLSGAPWDDDGRLLRGTGLAAGAGLAVMAKIVVDRDTGHAFLPEYRLALTEDCGFDPETGAPLATSLTGLGLPGSFTLPPLDLVPLPGPVPDHAAAWITALTAAAILVALRDALGTPPTHLPMTPDRVLALLPGPPPAPDPRT